MAKMEKTAKGDLTADLRALEAIRPSVGPSAERPPAFATEIQKRWFPPRRGGHSAYVGNPLDLAKLGKDERRVLELLCAVDCGESWAHSGLPPDIRSRRRVLGLDPPGILETAIACAALGNGKHPRWKVLRLALDTYGRKYANKPDRPPLQPWLAERWFDLAPMEWLELWTEVKARSYGGMTAWGDPITGALLAVSKAERHAWAKRWCDTILRSPDRQLQAFVGKTVALAYTLTNEAVPAPITKMLAMKPALEPKVAPKAPEPKGKKGSYVFFGKKAYDLAGIQALDASSQRQFLAAAKLYGGKAFATPRAFFAWEAKEQETTIDGVDAIRWKIARAPAKKAVFDMWVFLVDNGAVFEVGSTRTAGLGMYQGRFKPLDRKRTDLESLSRELQANAPF